MLHKPNNLFLAALANQEQNRKLAALKPKRSKAGKKNKPRLGDVERN